MSWMKSLKHTKYLSDYLSGYTSLSQRSAPGSTDLSVPATVTGRDSSDVSSLTDQYSTTQLTVLNQTATDAGSISSTHSKKLLLLLL